jgi:hypothetical protein
LVFTRVNVAERLRRWTANPLGSPRVGSNPIVHASFLPLFIFSTCQTLAAGLWD